MGIGCFNSQLIINNENKTFTNIMIQNNNIFLTPNSFAKIIKIQNKTKSFLNKVYFRKNLKFQFDKLIKELDSIKLLNEEVITNSKSYKYYQEYFKNKLQDVKYDRVLDNKEKFQYNWKFNLAQGSIAKKIEDESLSNELTKIAKHVCDEINLKFGSIDIIQTINNELYVMEVNSGIMIENYIKLNPNEYITIKNIYRSAIEKMFKE